MKLYHGTNIPFEDILLSKCLPYKDFGKGFYLTPIRKRALERALDKCDKTGEGVPVVQTYEIDDSTLTDRKIKESMTKSEFEFIVNHQVEKMVEFLMEDYGMSMKDAFDRVYSSNVYLKLQNKRSGLYRYSPAYTYLLLQ